VAKKSASRTKKRAEGKKRTREHVIADISLAHVQFFVANAGFTSEATTKDYGYDLSVNTFDKEGLIEPLAILIQLKGSEVLNLHPDGVSYWFPLDIRDYNLWMQEANPVFLLLYQATSNRAYWLYFQQYMKSPASHKPKKGARTFRVKIPKINRVRTNFFRHARHLKSRVFDKLIGVELHG
jgi:hypothetical protein